LQVSPAASEPAQDPVGGVTGHAALLQLQAAPPSTASQEQTVDVGYLQPPKFVIVVIVEREQPLPPCWYGQGLVPLHAHLGPPFAGVQTQGVRASPPGRTQTSPTGYVLQSPSTVTPAQSKPPEPPEPPPAVPLDPPLPVVAAPPPRPPVPPRPAALPA
jgi:hypothetical protein